MYLMMVAEHRAACPDPATEDGEVLLQQDQVGRLLGDVHRVVDADADVASPERCRVVDAVAEKAHHVAQAVQSADDAAPCPSASAWQRPAYAPPAHGALASDMALTSWPDSIVAHSRPTDWQTWRQTAAFVSAQHLDRDALVGQTAKRLRRALLGGGPRKPAHRTAPAGTRPPRCTQDGRELGAVVQPAAAPAAHPHSAYRIAFGWSS